MSSRFIVVPQPDGASIEDSSQLQHEAFQQRLSRNFRWVIENFNCCAGTVDVDFLFDGVNQPTELCAVVNVLLHFVLQHWQGIAPGPEFHYEFRAKPGK